MTSPVKLKLERRQIKKSTKVQAPLAVRPRVLFIFRFYLRVPFMDKGIHTPIT